MKNCKDPKSIKITSTIGGVSPNEHLEESAGEEESGEAAVNEHGKAVYKQSCAVCHDHGVAGAPKVGEADAWEARIATGIEAMSKRANEGYTGDAGMMPPKGGNMSLSDEDVTAAVEYMVEQSK
jgi:cytochrome c